MSADHLATHIEQQVSAAPPLSADQRDKLAGLLRPAVSDSR